MALGATYATLDELKTQVGIPSSDTVDDSKLTIALNAASRGIELVCNRQFNDATTASARVYYPEHSGRVEVDDFHTAVGLLVKSDDGDDGVYETEWASTDYQLMPLNGIVSGQSGWPFNEILSVGTRWFPRCARRPSVEVTARWGWAAVPDGVKQACLLSAEELFKLKDAPFGVAGTGEWGSVRVKQNPFVMLQLGPYIRDAVLIA